MAVLLLLEPECHLCASNHVLLLVLLGLHHLVLLHHGQLGGQAQEPKSLKVSVKFVPTLRKLQELRRLSIMNTSPAST